MGRRDRFPVPADIKTRCTDKSPTLVRNNMCWKERSPVLIYKGRRHKFLTPLHDLAKVERSPPLLTST